MLDDLMEVPEVAARYGRRLAIVVPYRDRAEHLSQLLPHFQIRYCIQWHHLDRECL